MKMAVKSKKSIEAAKKLNLTIGYYLRDKRIEADLSQKDVALLCGYNAQFVSNWERGMSLPPMTIIKKLLKIYHVPAHEFIDLMIDSQRSLLEVQLGLKSGA